MFEKWDEVYFDNDGTNGAMAKGFSFCVTYRVRFRIEHIFLWLMGDMCV